ncbi:MAG TPA: cyclase family protein [Candidatus Limnocylindrales bacterium]|nr:cyclase family protein [Candidatus Limnocylindrales bacterium]
MTWLDISVPIRPGMPTFEGDPTVTLERVAAIADGAVCNVSRLDFGVHSGTHVDAPVHFLDGAAGIEAVPVDALIGPAVVVEARAESGPIDAAAVDRLAIPPGTERILIRSRNSELWATATFQPTFIGFDGSGARRLVELGVRLVGVDYLSVAVFGDPTPTHTALLEAGVVIVEGLDLRAIDPGRYELVCLPLLIPGSDGGPARALVRRIEP